MSSDEARERQLARVQRVQHRRVEAWFDSVEERMERIRRMPSEARPRAAERAAVQLFVSNALSTPSLTANICL